MKVQCSILESQLRCLKESPLRALNGNQDPPVIQYRYASAQRAMIGIRSLFIEGDLGGTSFVPTHPIPATPMEYAVWRFTKFAKRTDNVFVHRDGRTESFDQSYSGTCSYAGGGKARAVSGYPLGLIAADGNYVGFTAERSTIFNPYTGGLSPPNVDLLGDASGPIGAEDSYSTSRSTIGSWAITLSDKIDFAPVYNGVAGDLLANDFPANFSINGPGITYRDAPQPLDASEVNPDDYDGARIVQPGGGGAGGFFPCTSGWDIRFGSLQLFRGQAKFVAGTTAETYYWIGRWRECTGPGIQDGYAHNATTGRPAVKRQVDFISDGFLQANQVIGVDVALPFPSSNPFPIQGISGPGADPGGVLADFYFAMIGQDPAKLFLQGTGPIPLGVTLA